MTTSTLPPATSIRQVTLLAASTDGTIVVDQQTMRSPAAPVGAGDNPHSVLQRLQEPFGPDQARVVALDWDTRTGTLHLVAHHGTTITPAGEHPNGYRHVPFGLAITTLPSSDKAVMQAACRAVLLGHTAWLTDGRPPQARPSKAELAGERFQWFPGALPHGQHATHVWGWLTDPYGRVLIMIDPNGTPSLPGGRPEPGETLTQALAREAAEEAQVTLDTPTMIGYQTVTDAAGRSRIQARMTARLQAIAASQTDVDSGLTYQRVLVPLPQANLLLGWGPEGDQQIAAVTATGVAWDTDATLMLVPAPGIEPA